MRIEKYTNCLGREEAVAQASVASGPKPPPASENNAVSGTVLYAEVAVTIRRSRAEVAAVMFDPRYDTDWIGHIRGSAKMAPGPIRRGTQIAREWRWFGRTIAETTEVKEHVPDRSIAMTTQLPFGLRIRYTLEGIPEGTIVRIHAEGRTTGVFRFAARLLDALLRSAVIRDLHRLKALVESGALRGPPI
ncbi:MAG TPA: SRPBCC family protein [Acetobacteraceae bacterium]|nr:SRPBCC family protein [Acetobacteraceae bacterium]